MQINSILLQSSCHYNGGIDSFSHLDLFKDRGIPEVYGAAKLATSVEGSSDYLMNFQVLLLSLRQLK